MTSSQIGVALGIHRNTVSNYLAGRSPIDRRTIVAWALACGVPVAWLESGSSPNDGPRDDPKGDPTSGHARTDVSLLRLVAA